MTRIGTTALTISVSFLYLNLCLMDSSFANKNESIKHTTVNADDPVPVIPPKNFIPENLVQVGNGPLHPKHIFIADKSKRTLTVWNVNADDFTLAGAYPMDIGKNDGDKISSGDQKTPEGVYFFEEKKEGPELVFSEYGKRAFTLDYPNVFDQRIGKSGHGIWLHAIPETKTLLRGSRGCVVVRNKIIDELTPMIRVQKTPMIITHEIKYVKAESLLEKRKNLENWLEQWRKSWESKDIDSYMKFYADDFKALKMNKSQWRQYKTALNKKYTFINIEIKNPMVISEKNSFIVQVLQKYKSDVINDAGEKILYVRETSNNEFEIVGEVFKALTNDALANIGIK
jgi:murein L,D-transpeptidase YafK